MIPMNKDTNKDKIARLQEFTLLFDTAWATYKAHFLRLLKVNSLPVIAVTALLAIFPFIGDFQTIVEYLQAGDIVRILALIFGISTLVVGISSLNYIAQIRVVSSEEEVSTISTYEYASKFLFSYIWVLILTGLCILAGFILLIVPGIVVAVWLSLTSFVLITGKAKGLEALRLSKRYVRGIWLQVFVRLLAAAFLGMLVSSAFAILQSFIKDIFGANLYFENILNLVYQLVVAPYFVVYGYELYKDVVRANEVEEVITEVAVEGVSVGGDTSASVTDTEVGQKTIE